MQMRTRLREPGAIRALARNVFEVVDADVLERDLTSRPVHPPCPIAGVRVVRTDEEGSLPLQRSEQRRFRPFLRRGDTGVLAVRGDRAVGWVWLSTASHRDPWSGLRIRLAADEGYVYDLWTDPVVRQLGLGRALLGSILAHAQDDLRLSRVYGFVDQRNRDSEVLLRLLGYTDVQALQRVHVLRSTGWMRRGSDRPPFGPMSAHGRHRP